MLEREHERPNELLPEKKCFSPSFFSKHWIYEINLILLSLKSPDVFTYFCLKHIYIWISTNYSHNLTDKLLST